MLPGETVGLNLLVPRERSMGLPVFMGCEGLGSDQRCRDTHRHKQGPTAPAPLGCGPVSCIYPAHLMPVAHTHTQEVQEVAVQSVEFIWRRGIFCRTEMGLMGWGQDEDQKWGTREPC